MNTHAEKSDKNKSQAIANTLSQKQGSNKPTIVSQRKLQELANSSPQALQLKALQQMANSRSVTQAKGISYGSAPVQLFKGAAGTNQAGANIPFTFNAVFMAKHIAADEAGAIAKTQTRVTNRATDIGGAGIFAGNIGNTVATNGVWTAAINGNAEEIPGADECVLPTEEDRAEAGFNASEFNATGRFPDSAYMAVSGWDVKLVDGNLVATEKTMNRKVGGDWTLNNLNASLDIDHCTQ